MTRVIIAIIRVYQRVLSPMKRVPTCRFVPTCSCYAIGALETYGTFSGGKRALWRIFRCHPWGSSGFDPVTPVTRQGSPKVHKARETS